MKVFCLYGWLTGDDTVEFCALLKNDAVVAIKKIQALLFVFPQHFGQKHPL